MKDGEEEEKQRLGERESEWKGEREKEIMREGGRDNSKMGNALLTIKYEKMKDYKFWRQRREKCIKQKET